METRDWVNTIEPRNVRAVMKRVVEDTTSIDVQVTHRTFVPNVICKKNLNHLHKPIVMFLFLAYV